MKDTISDNQTIVSRTGGIINQFLRTISRIISMLLFGCVLSVFSFGLIKGQISQFK